jgi:hypothetical protein
MFGFDGILDIIGLVFLSQLDFVLFLVFDGIGSIIGFLIEKG